MDPSHCRIRHEHQHHHESKAGAEFGLPYAVMRTAVKSSEPIPIKFSGGPDDYYHFVMDFAEVLPATGRRNLTIKINGDDWYGPFTLDYRDMMAIFSQEPEQYAQYSFSVEANNGSDYGPILNAFEVFRFVRPSGAATLPQDAFRTLTEKLFLLYTVLAIKAVQDYYQIKKNWNADPCLPLDAPWEGLTCSPDNQSSPRIEALDLSSNNLSGSIPSSLKEKEANGLTLRQSLAAFFLRIDNNPQICRQDSCNQGKASGKRKILIVIISVVSSSVVAVGIILSILAFITVNSRRKRRDNNRERKSSRASGKICTFVYDEIVEITNNFERVIGKGGSCTVFYGRLWDGREVAVKLMTGIFSQGIKEYTAEVNYSVTKYDIFALFLWNKYLEVTVCILFQVELLMKVHHKCLVSFIGFCDEDQKMILVYEYMKKGDLQMLLSGEIETPDMLDWRQRLQIAHSVATGSLSEPDPIFAGLEYLHAGCRPPIIHRDVKARNILLNDKLEAKIADFGLSKICITEGTSHVSTVVAGTPGYIDPEYYSTNKLTEKSDVYSFGIVLFELITGQNAVLTRGSQRVHNLEFVMPKIMSGDVASIVDPRLQGQYDINSVWKVAEMAIGCTAKKGITRPTMTEIVRELEEATDIETEHQLQSKRQSEELGSILLSTNPALLDMDSFSRPSAR
ncbi:Nodulation receptor kinase [Nymphaea thermarum]|nr:Nodulation receptor kinase [Nymphaea thermarum]